MFRRICAALLVLGLASAPAAGQTIEFAYTSFDSAKCRHTPSKEKEDDGSWLCAGYGGLPVRLSSADQRMQVTYGSWKKDDLARSQTLPGFNDVFQGTIEWRIARQPDGSLRPFATILRWNVVTAEDNEKGTGKTTGRVLVVTRLGPGGVCHVGYVDARANPEANELARKIADERARTFRCGKDKRIVLGKTAGIDLPQDAGN